MLETSWNHQHHATSPCVQCIAFCGPNPNFLMAPEGVSTSVDADNKTWQCHPQSHWFIPLHLGASHGSQLLMISCPVGSSDSHHRVNPYWKRSHYTYSIFIGSGISSYHISPRPNHFGLHALGDIASCDLSQHAFHLNTSDINLL